MNPLLSRLSDKTYSVATSTKFSRSHNNYGFNFYIEGNSARIYYHAPKVENLPKGRYFLCYEVSSLVEGRQDAISVFSDKAFQALVEEAIAQAPLSSEFESLLASHHEFPQLTADAVLKQVQALLVQDEQTHLPVVLKNAEQLGISTAHTVVNLYQGKITTFDAFYADVHQGGISASLTTELNRRAANTLFAQFEDLEAGIEESKSRGILTSEIKSLAAKAIMECPSRAAKLGLETLSYVAESTTFQPTIEQFEQLFAVLDIERAQAIARYLPVEAISRFPDYVKSSQLLGYLQLDEVDAHEPILDELFQRLIVVCKAASPTPFEDVSAHELRSLLRKANTEAIVTAYFSELTADKAILLNGLYTHHFDAPVIRSSIYQLILRFEECGFADLVKCFDAELIETQLDEKLVQQISKNYGVFLSRFDNGQQALCERFPLEEFLHYAQYASEGRFIQFLMQFGDGCSASELANLNKAATQNDFHQASLLVALLEQKVTRGGASVQSITALFDNFQKGLFEHHAKSRTKIELSILAVCQWLTEGQGISADRFSKRSVCEGKLWFANIKDEKGAVTGEKEPKALCRRNDCTKCVFDGMENIDPFKGKTYQRQYVRLPRALTFKEMPFYTLVHHLFGITAEHLHQHDAFVRMLSAINRWNEILEKLICRQCDNPLQIAEHSKGSIGYLAVGTTYWHCGSEPCGSYGESVKISYCIGCQKYIDSRDDKKSCTPYEIRSYKKFYICNDCGSCCSKHNGFAGICPHCGKDGAFNDIHQTGRTRAKCKHCDEVTNIGHFAFQALAKHKVNGGVFSHIRSLSSSSSHLVGAVVDNTGNTNWLVSDAPWNNYTLYIYDLYESLRTNKITRQMLSKYHGVYDLKVIEKLALLGLNHSRYGSQEAQSALEKLFDESIAEGSFHKNQDAIFDLVRRYFQTLHDTKMWDHYNNVEHKFITALHALSEPGLSISEFVLKDELAKLERSRNQYVQKLNALKVFDIDKPSLINYLKDKFTSNEAEFLINQLERHGSKPLRSLDHSFEHLHGIEKTERAAGIIQKLLALPRNVKPNYQIVGTSTSRCTSRSPNLMNLPKESRHILKAGYGNSIIECDYKQMEIGVLAALSGDQQLISDFNTGDVYEKFGTALAITREQAKMILLGLIYGMSALTIATQLGVIKSIAEDYINGFFARYPNVKKYQNELLAQGANQGYVTSCTGLRRSVNRHVVKNSAILNWEQNWFKNFPVQSSAASVFKLSIVELARELHGEQFKLLVPHYDAIVFEVPEAQASHYTEQVKAAMHRAMKKQFPMLEPQIDVKSCGQSWGEQAQEMDSSSRHQRQSIEDLPF